jgi:hypothetical protein
VAADRAAILLTVGKSPGFERTDRKSLPFGLETAAVAAPNTTNLTRKLQNHWSECLNQSYRTTIKQTPDKNTAAEMAFQACSSEEQDLASYVNAQVPIAYSPMPHLKAETKRVLVEEGHL